MTDADQPPAGPERPSGVPWPVPEAAAVPEPAADAAEPLPPAGPPPGYPYLQPATPPELHEPQPFPPADVPAPPRRRGRLPLVVGIVAGVLAVAVIAALLIRGATRVTPPDTGGPTASEAVQGYLQALARGDATAALAWADVTPSDTRMLTDEALASALARAPLTDIAVDPSPGGASYEQVTARYRIGSRAVTATFDVVRSGQEWRLDEVSAPARLERIDTGKAGLKVNGVEVGGTEVQLFPGSYALTTADARFRISSGTFVVESPDRSPDLYSAELALSRQGRDDIATASRRHLADCIGRQQLMPKGCGFGARAAAGVSFEPSGIHWRVVSGRDRLDRLDLVLDTPTSAWARVRIRIGGNLTSTDGRRWTATSLIRVVKADLSGTKVAVTFE